MFLDFLPFIHCTICEIDIQGCLLQRALIGMDIPLYDNRRTANEYNIFNSGNDEFSLDDDYIEVRSFPVLNM